jgi:hypothetical protein
MNKKAASSASAPRTHRDVVAALMLEEIDTLLDKVEALTASINGAGDKLQVTINQLETASDTYHQAVLAANLRSKNEMLAYLGTVSKEIIAKTADEQRALVQGLIREAVSNEVITLKKVLSDLTTSHRVPFKDRWGFLLLGCTLIALIGSTITVALMKYLGVI